MSRRNVKTGKGLIGIASSWFGLLGVVAAAAAIVLVPVTLDPEVLSKNPGRAYHVPQARVLLSIAVALLVALIGSSVLHRKSILVPMLGPVLALLGVSALSTFFSGRPVYSLYGDRSEGLLPLVAGVLLFYALARGLTSNSRVRLFLVAAVTTAVLVSIYGIAQKYGLGPIVGWGTPPFTDLGRSSATIGNPITLAAYLTIMMGMAVALWLSAGSRFERTMWLVALVVIGACWIYAETRGALLGACLALPITLLATHRRMETAKPLMVPVVVLVAAMTVAVAVSKLFGFSTLSIHACIVLLTYLTFLAVLFWLLERGRTRIALLFLLVVLAGVGVTALTAVSSGNLNLADVGLGRVKPEVSQNGGDLSVQIRLQIWRDTIPMILDRPLFGHGLDNYSRPFWPYVSEDLRAAIGDRGVDRVHNHLLQLAATTGLLGLTAYLWILVSYLRNVYSYGGWELAALSGGILAYVLQLQTAFPSVATNVAFWSVLGVSSALMQLRGREGDEAQPCSEAPAKGGDEVRGKTSYDTVIMGSRRNRRCRKSFGRGELLVAVTVVGLLAALAVPVFMEQHEKFIESERDVLATEVREAVEFYERVGNYRGTYPEPGVYTSENPIRNARGRPAVRLPRGVTVTTKVTPAGEFTIEGKNAVLAGTFWYSYDSASGEYSSAPSPST